MMPQEPVPNNFGSAEDLTALLDKIGVRAEENLDDGRNTLREEVFKAIRKANSSHMEKAYHRAIKKMGDNIQYSSPRHLITGLYGIMSDFVYSFMIPQKEGADTKNKFIQALYDSAKNSPIKDYSQKEIE